MKKMAVTTAALVLGISALMATGCATTGSAAKTKGVGFEKHPIGYPKGYDPLAQGASSYDSCDDYPDSPYFKPLDVYNMKSTGSLTVIPHFATYQQTTEYTCGAASALMVLNHYNAYDPEKYDEMSIAKLAGTNDQVGTTVEGLAGFFTKIGWNVQRNPTDGSPTFDYLNDGEHAIPKFISWVTTNLKENHPILVDWTDWDGHWQVIIGYDTMGTPDVIGDDVIILADPYDTSDQYQDGYYTYPAERFMYMWHESASLTATPEMQPFIIATPPQK